MGSSRTPSEYWVSLADAGTQRQWRALGTLVLLAPGVAVGIATLVRLVRPAVSTVGRLVMIAALVCIASPLLVGTKWLLASDLDPVAVRRLVAWSLAGSVPITALALIVVGYQQAQGVVLSDPLLVTGWVAGTGAIGGLLTGVYDVRREQERRRSSHVQNRLSAIVEASPVAVIAVGDNGTVQSWSSSAERLFGWSADEILDEPYPLIPDDRREEYRRHKQRVDNGYVIDGVETKRRARDGALVDVNLWAAPITDADENVSEHMIALADITDRKQREQQLTVLDRVLRHDIRNTVNVIDGQGSMLMGALEAADHAEAARRIVARARRLERLSEKARDVTSVLRAADEIREVDVVDLLDQQRQRFEREHPDCRLITDVPQSALVAGDQRLEIAFREAIENALEHGQREAQDGSDAKVVLRVQRDDEHVVVDVIDTGPGIPQRERDPLTAETETSLSHGSGIGLWTIHWLVRSLGGSVRISDRDPHGAVVTMRLPVAQRPGRRTD